MQRFIQGATVSLSFSHESYPKANWSAELILKGVTSSQTFTAAPDANEEKFLVKISATDTAQIAAGVYRASYRYRNLAGDVQIIPGKQVEFLNDPSLTGDHRTQYEKDLEAVENAIRQKIAGGSVEEYEIHTVNGRRRVKNMTLEDLRGHRRWLVRMINADRRSKGQRPLGNDRWRKIKTGLGDQSPVQRRRY